MPRPKKSAGAQSGEEPQAQKVVVRISRQQWFLLKSVALQRSLRQGSRVTLDEVLAETIEGQRKDLEKELR